MSNAINKALWVAIVAMACLGSCTPHHKSKLEEGRQNIHLRAMERVDSLTAALAEADSLLAVNRVLTDSLERLLTKVPNPVEPYLVAKGAPAPATGLQGRLNEIEGGTDVVFYLVATATPPRVRFTRIGVSDSADGPWIMTGAVDPDGERNDILSNRQTVHYLGALADSVGATLAAWPSDRSGYILFTDATGSQFTTVLPARDAAAIATAYRYNTAIKGLRHAAIEHERLERLLETARQHVARTMADIPAEQ